MEARTCLVTGAGRGTGRAVAERLSAQGHRVAPTARGTEALREVSTRLPGPSMAVTADLTEAAGSVDTPMTDATVATISERTGRSGQEARQVLQDRQPIGRLVTPAAVADAVTFCVSNPAVTGQGINVDGGAVQS